jgi:hypothetical protein
MGVLVWNTETLYNGHRAGHDVRAILDGIGASFGFTVDDALENYAPPQQETLGEFQLAPREPFCQRETNRCRRQQI